LLGQDGGVLLIVRDEDRLGFVNWRRALRVSALATASM
jgi:hypothetical protein